MPEGKEDCARPDEPGELIDIVCFIVRDMKGLGRTVFPELLVWQRQGGRCNLPRGICRSGQDARRLALHFAHRHSGLYHYTSIRELAPSGAARLFLLHRSEPPGSLSHWRHLLDGERLEVRWLPLDGQIPLTAADQSLLAAYEPLLLD